MVSEYLYLHHFFEYGLSSILLSYLQPRMTFVDVGAHFGYFTLLASRILSKEGMVHSFEPTKNTFEILQKNTSEKKNVITNQMAVWSSDTNLEFNEFDERFSAFNSLKKPNFPKHGHIKKTFVKTTSLDNYFKAELPDFVKIDSEGAESEILEGMKKIIREKKPYITLEVGLRNNIASEKRCIKFLQDQNYNVFEFSNGKLQPHKPKDSHTYDNLFFKPNK